MRSFSFRYNISMKRFPSIRKNTEYQEIYRTAPSKATGLLVMYVRDGAQEGNRLGISVSKRVGNSVVRHTFVRRMREIFRLNDSQTLKGKDILIFARNQAGQVSYDRLNKDYVKLLRHHGIYEELK